MSPLPDYRARRDGDRSLGYAVVRDGEIIVKTVSDTRRAAIVNWLVVERDHLITRNCTDQEIEDIWHSETQSEIETLPITKVELVGITRISEDAP